MEENLHNGLLVEDDHDGANDHDGAKMIMMVSTDGTKKMMMVSNITSTAHSSVSKGHRSLKICTQPNFGVLN